MVRRDAAGNGLRSTQICFWMELALLPRGGTFATPGQKHPGV